MDVRPLEEIRLAAEHKMKESYSNMLARKEQELRIKNEEIDTLKKIDEIKQRVRDREEMRYNLITAPAQSIYIYEDNRGLHKIGKTKGEVTKRTNAQKTSLPELKLKGEYKCIKCQVIEDVIHFVLKEHRVDKTANFSILILRKQILLFAILSFLLMAIDGWIKILLYLVIYRYNLSNKRMLLYKPHSFIEQVI